MPIARLLKTMLLIAGACAGAASAQTPDDREITVTGRHAELTSTLKAVLSETGFGQLGRFETPVCIGVSGLSEDYAATVVGLIRANAEAAGARLEKEGCRPNAVLVFYSDPGELVTGWQQRSRDMFGSLSDSEIAAMARRPGPVISWRATETMRYDGVQPDRLESVDGVNAGKGAMIVRNALATRNEENVRQDINLSVAVIDSDAIRGKTLQQLADVATLHLLLDLAPDAAERAGDGSILSLFRPRPADAAAPAGLTVFDRGMLKGIYGEVRNNFNAHRQRGRIVRQITQEVDETD